MTKSPQIDYAGMAERSKSSVFADSAASGDMATSRAPFGKRRRQKLTESRGDNVESNENISSGVLTDGSVAQPGAMNYEELEHRTQKWIPVLG